MNIELFLKTAGLESPAIQAARNGQLHLTTLGLAKEAGVKTASEFDIATALHTLGAKTYIKRAQWRMVSAGLEAMKGLENE
jgi:hypothetical protein